MPIQEGIYTQDQINQMGLNFNETTSAQPVGSQWYKLENTGDNRRQVKIVQPVGAGQGAGGFTYGNQPQSTQGTQGATSLGIANQAVPNLPELYKTLTSSSGVGALEQELSQKNEAYNKAVSQINDNPFLSEASRVGRIQKLTTDFNNSIANLKNDITTKKADVETQLNLQTKQFDINSTAATNALNQFNSLLEAGTLDSASADDIANITRSTGLSSSAISSAINARKAELAESRKPKTQVVSYDDGTNQGYAVVNTDSGEIINTQIVAASKPESTSSGTVSAKDSNKAIAAVNTALQGKAVKKDKYGKVISTGKDKYVDWNEFMSAVNAAMAIGVDQEEAQNLVLQQMKVLGKQPYQWK